MHELSPLPENATIICSTVRKHGGRLQSTPYQKEKSFPTVMVRFQLRKQDLGQVMPQGGCNEGRCQCHRKSGRGSGGRKVSSYDRKFLTSLMARGTGEETVSPGPQC